MKDFLIQLWNFIIRHYWTKDLLRANILYILIIVLYNILQILSHHLAAVSGYIFINYLLLMNICLIARLAFLKVFNQRY